MQTKLSLIWAMDEQQLIGNNNQLPWKLPADMVWFRQHTLGKPILMGRKTFDSIGKPLPKRKNLVLTQQQNLQIEGCDVVFDIQSAVQVVQGQEELMVIGGAQVYALCMAQAQRLYVTRIHSRFEGDAWFPEVDWSQWQEVFCEQHPADELNPYAYSFYIYERRSA